MSVRSRVFAAMAWSMAVVLLLAACAVPDGSGGSPAAGTSGTEPSEDALVVDFDGLPVAQDCDPAAPKVVPLGELTREGIDNPYVQGGGAQAIFVDVGGVQVAISVYARDHEEPDAEGPINTYFDELKACFEIQQGGPPGGFDELSVEAPEATLLKGVEAMFGLDPAGLRARRGELMSDNNIAVGDGVGLSLEEIVTQLGGDSGKLLDEARTSALDNVSAAAVSGTIAAEQAARLRAVIDEGYLDELYRDPDAATLIQPPADPGEVLNADPENLVVEFDIKGDPSENAVVFFAIDPRIYQSKWQYYTWLKGTYVSTTVRAEEGKVCEYLLRYISQLEWRGSRCPIAVSTSTAMTAYSSIATWHSARVYGVYSNGDRGSYYQLYGAWRAT